MAKIALVDDHVLLRNGLAGLIRDLGHTVLFEADHGRELVQKLDPLALPDIILLDINMPEMDGYETARWMKQHHPDVKILALSMYDNEKAIINMLRSGAKGYILKDSDPAQLNSALHDLLQKGFYYSDLVSGKLIHAINGLEEKGSSENYANINDRETEFLKYACTELTYKEIAEKMYLSPRTIDGYRDSLFEKLNIKTRVGLAMYAIKTGLVEIN
ncbi:response regulator transcription factor [Ferruginibacter sp. HRS2-29]|uniref:response regulator transcription factor n=1 Tax=Ferruginibacter sp. HRS2-29 TaxID=2487334 RepID=UPI0020CEDD2E|nr:response regulator transcription factor [Ferruginibacter sp. HRS2-29]MCP9752087.1 DNA-binding response regulator [Ferruginibacter sp. HRS2-29]